MKLYVLVIKVCMQYLDLVSDMSEGQSLKDVIDRSTSSPEETSGGLDVTRPCICNGKGIGQHPRDVRFTRINSLVMADEFQDTGPAADD